MIWKRKKWHATAKKQNVRGAESVCREPGGQNRVLQAVKEGNIMGYQLQEPIPYAGSYDVIVAGGGPAGCAAAAAAARSGAKTLLVESTGALGGMGTSGLVPAWCPFSDQETILYRGIAQEVFEACKKGMPHVKPDALDWVPIDPERLKTVYDDLVAGSGAEILFNTFIGRAEAKDGTVEALVAANKAGLSAYTAKIYVDCTGDADLAAWAGAQFHKGDGKTGEVQMSTHCFILSNVDDYAYWTGPSLHTSNPGSPIYKILASGKYPEIIDAHMCNNTIGPGTVGFNAGHLVDVDGTDPKSTSEALMKGRKIARAMRDGLAEFDPAAFGNAFLVETGALMGIRESRRIVGDYTLTEDDYLAKAVFPDEVCRCSYYIDIHRSPKDKKEGKTDDTLKKYPPYGKGESFGVPYRCLTPKSLKNVLVAGRSISCMRALQGSTRVMPVCLAVGQAAGTAAAMAAGSGTVDVHRLDTKLLREKLRKAGAYFR